MPSDYRKLQQFKMHGLTKEITVNGINEMGRGKKPIIKNCKLNWFFIRCQSKLIWYIRLFIHFPIVAYARYLLLYSSGTFTCRIDWIWIYAARHFNVSFSSFHHILFFIVVFFLPIFDANMYRPCDHGLAGHIQLKFNWLKA